MKIEAIDDVIRFGLAYERLRVETASYNLALANVALAPGATSPLLKVAQAPNFQSQLNASQLSSKNVNVSEFREVHDPHHPMADAAGMVHYPKIEAANEMATMVSATRAYEANIRAYNTIADMNRKAFEIGKN